MSILNINVKFTGPVPGWVNLRQREFNQLVRETWYEVGRYWHTQLLPKHFTVEGGKEYDYAPRKGEGLSGKAYWKSYLGRKRKKWGHQMPLVWSGDLQERSRTARMTAEVTGTKGSQLKITLTRAQKANWKNPHSDPRLEMPDEMTRISAAERNLLVEMFDEILQGKLDDLEYAREVSMPIGGFEAFGAT